MARFPFIRPASGTRPRRADSLDVVAEPVLRRLADYWLSRRGGHAMPRRADIDPVDMPWALSQLFLVDCVSDAGRGADGGRWRYRYRLAGEDVEKVFRASSGKQSLRGVWLDDILEPQHLTPVMARWRPLPEDGCIVYMQGMVYRLADCLARGGRIMLPLADEPGGPVTGLIGATDCDWECSKADESAAAMPADIAVTYIPASVLA